MNETTKKETEVSPYPEFIQRPSPEWIISVFPEDHRHEMTLVEDKKTNHFFSLPGWMPGTITRHASELKIAFFRTKGAGYGVWPLEEYARPGFTSAADIAEHHAGEWIRVQCYGKNGYKFEIISDIEPYDWSNFEPYKGIPLRMPPTEKYNVIHSTFKSSIVQDQKHPVLKPILRKNRKEKREKEAKRIERVAKNKGATK